MAVNKNFVVKNGLEVNTDLLFADSATRSVGVGSTSPNFDLDVRGGIGATDLRVTGFTTLTKDFQVGASGSAFYVSNTNNLVGVGTSVPAFLMDIRSSVSSGQTALYVKGDMRVTGDINLDDLTIDDLTVTGIATYKPDGSGGSPDSWIDIDYTGNTTTGGGTTVGFGSTAYFVDNAKVVFGASEDLEIYHLTGNTSHIHHKNASGNLRIRSGGTIIANSADDEIIAQFLDDREGVKLYNDGNIKFAVTPAGVTVAGGSSITGISTVLDTTQSSSTTTGALQVSGGVGVAKNLFVGGGAQVTGVTTITGTLDANGALDVDGHTELDDVNVAGAATFAGAIDANSTSDFNGVVTVSNTTQSSSKDTGAIIVEGGAGIEKNLFVGGGAQVTGVTTITGTLDANGALDVDGHTELDDVNVAGASTFAGAIDANATTQSSASTNGAATFAGGVGVAKNLFVGGGAQVSAAFTVGSGIGVTTILDQDDMAANSATALASQQSIKAYVDTQITAEDLDFSGDSGTGAVDLDSQTLAISGTASEIKTVASGQSLTISLPDDIIVGNGLTVTGIGSFLNDVNFRGKSGLTSAFWDKTESSLKWNDGAKAEFGDSQDLEIYHSGSHANIYNKTGELRIRAGGDETIRLMNAAGNQHMIIAEAGESVTLYEANVKKFETTPAGTITTGISTADGFSVGDFEYITAGIGSDLALYHDTSNSWIKNTTNTLILASNLLELKNEAGTKSYLKGTADAATEIYWNNSKKFETGPAGVIITGICTADGFRVGDSEKVQFGTGDDSAIYYTGSAFYIDNNVAGDTFIRSTNINLQTNSATSSENSVVGTANSGVSLYYDGSRRLFTTTDGADVEGTGSIKVPVGTTAQRNGSPTDGDIRYNSTLNTYEGYGNSAWGGLGGGTEIDTSVSSTSATSITTFAHASYRSASIRIQIVQGSAYQVGRYLLIHDGTTVTIIEESAIATGSMLGTITAAIVSTNVVIYVNMGSSSSATVTTIIDKITV